MALDERFLTQAQSFITETLDAEIPDLNTDGGSAVSDILANGGGVIAATVLQEVDNVVQSRDLSDPEALSEEEIDLFLENLLTERNQGATARGFVDVHFEQRVLREFAEGLRFTTSDRTLNFITATDLTFNPEDYFQDAQRGTYFVRVPVFAEAPGVDYNVDPGDISVALDNRTDIVFVSNSSALYGGLAAQTNTQAVRTARRSISTRTQINVDGSVYAGQQLFGQKLLDLLVIGNGDPEMIRDELHDQGEGNDPRWTLGPEGTATGVHIGGRTDLYNWYRNLNYVEETVDVFADLLLNQNLQAGASLSSFAIFPAGGTGTVPATGKLTFELGSVAEETISYSAVSFDALSGIYTFTLESTPQFDHLAGTSVRVANSGIITVAPDGDVSVLPVLQVASIRLLDPVTFEPIGDPIPRTDEDSLSPGWYFSDFNAQNHMSAKETKSIVLDEKRDLPGNAAQSGAAGVLSFTTNVNFSDAGADFTGYQGRSISLTGTFGTVTRTIVQVASATSVVLSGATLGAEAGVDWSIEENYGEYIQYPVRVSYYTHTEIEELQDFLDARRTRITTADILSRAFQPVFIDFNYRYRGTGGVSQVRENLLEVLRTSAEAAIGESEGAEFDYSDLVAAGYANNFANYVETPFEVVVTRVNQDGTEDKKFVNPEPGTVNNLVLSVALAGGEVFIETERPAQVAGSAIPDRGHIFLGTVTGAQEKLDYEAVAQDGSSFTFVLRDGQNVGNAHLAGEPLQATVIGYDPANVITDGVITDERIFRPYLGINVLVEKIE